MRYEISLTRLKIAPLVMTVVFSLVFCGTVQAGIKCWKNSDGVRECGNSIPPEYSQQSHTRFNNQGVAIQNSERAKTEAELMEEERLANKRRKEKLKLQRKKESDLLFLNTFSSSEDIILARDGKLTALKAEIELRESMIDKLRKNLAKILASAADMERRGKQPTDQILKDIKAVRSQIRDNQRYIINKRQEQVDVKRRYAEDLRRFDKLHESMSDS